MRSVTLAGTQIRTTALGFGTASLMGKIGKKESLRLLDVAYDCGIRHFDTAPLYGYGQSEAVLGIFLRGHPDVTVTTKFGLARPQLGSPLVRGVKNLARPILRAFPSLRARARQAVQSGAVMHSNFSPAAAAESLDQSLRLLQRDYVDLFLLHECRAADLHDDDLFAVLAAARERGRIRAFGIATDFATVDHAIATDSRYAPVVQLPNNRAEPNLERLPALVARACVTHSPFGGVGKATPPATGNALAYAARSNPNGIVLFSSQHPQHITANVEAFV